MCRKVAVMIVVCALLVSAIGAGAADLRQYVGIIRPEFNDQTKQLFLSLADMWKAQGQQDLADYFTNWAHGAWHGTGWVFVDSDGSNYIITNRHVAQQAERIDFQLEDPSGAVTSFNNCPILYVDADIDLAVAQFPNAQKVYTQGFPINAGIQSDGQEVWSAGYPGLLDQAGWQFAKGNVTNGQARVSQLLDPSISYVIQHSASIDPGNSGGPLLLKNDKSPLGYDVVGVNTWGIANRQNTFFSIPGSPLRSVLDKAKAAKALAADTAGLKSRLEKDAKILAAELGSETPDDARLAQFISYAFVGNLGYACWQADVATMSTAKAQSDSGKQFLDDPIETMRNSILKIFLAEMLLRSNNNLSSTEFLEISPADVDKIGPGQVIRTSFGVKGSKVEIQWVFEYGDWRISYVNMQKFAQLLGGGGTVAAGATGGGGTAAAQPAAAGRMGLEIFGGAGEKSAAGPFFGSSYVYNESAFAWSAGAVFTFPFSPYFGLGTGLMATMKGAYYESTAVNPSVYINWSIIYLELPVLLRAGLPIAISDANSMDIYVSLGFGLNYAVSKSGTLTGNSSYVFNQAFLSDLNSLAFSFIANAGVEYAFSKSLAFGVAALYDTHLGNDWTSSSANESTFTNVMFHAYLKFLF